MSGVVAVLSRLQQFLELLLRAVQPDAHRVRADAQGQGDLARWELLPGPEPQQLAVGLRAGRAAPRRAPRPVPGPRDRVPAPAAAPPAPDGRRCAGCSPGSRGPPRRPTPGRRRPARRRAAATAPAGRRRGRRRRSPGRCAGAGTAGAARRRPRPAPRTAGAGRRRPRQLPRSTVCPAGAPIFRRPRRRVRFSPTGSRARSCRPRRCCPPAGPTSARTPAPTVDPRHRPWARPARSTPTCRRRRIRSSRSTSPGPRRSSRRPRPCRRRRCRPPRCPRRRSRPRRCRSPGSRRPGERSSGCSSRTTSRMRASNAVSRSRSSASGTSSICSPNACSSSQMRRQLLHPRLAQRAGQAHHELGGQRVGHALEAGVVDRAGQVLRHHDVGRADEQDDLEGHGDRAAVAAAGQRVGLVAVERPVARRPRPARR